MYIRHYDFINVGKHALSCCYFLFTIINQHQTKDLETAFFGILFLLYLQYNHYWTHSCIERLSVQSCVSGACITVSLCVGVYGRSQCKSVRIAQWARTQNCCWCKSPPSINTVSNLPFNVLFIAKGCQRQKATRYMCLFLFIGEWCYGIDSSEDAKNEISKESNV